MPTIFGDIDGTKQFINYVVPIVRTDHKTGIRLGVKNFRLRKPFSFSPIEETAPLDRSIEGAANGSESIIQG